MLPRPSRARLTVRSLVGCGLVWRVLPMAFRFPAVEPSDIEMLDVGDGHQVYWEACGNADGRPAIYLHGGPGSGSTPDARRYFDPDAYRVVLFDQRGSGRSRPLASEPDTDLST